ILVFVEPSSQIASRGERQMIERRFEDKTELDYIGMLETRMTGYAGVVSLVVLKGPKEGKASADLRASEGGVITLDHAGQCLMITTEAELTNKVAERMKALWRAARAPKLTHHR